MRSDVEVIEDRRWGRSCLGYNVQLPIVGDAAQAFAAAQAHLLTLLGARIRPIPGDALHISTYGVIPVTWDSPHKEAVWNRLSAAVHTLVARRCERASPFSLAFEQVRVERQAIISVATESNALIEDLRDDLAALVAPTSIPPRSYAIVHSTLARFSQSGTMDSELVAQVDQTPLRTIVNVERVQLVCERVYPSLSLELLASWPLSARAGPLQTVEER
ncbi:MAG TPA: 2'-5' RNA ligase family protein [Polyangiales bacterium]|nr:2'-5' RNA ligase family protein [Polyangiales bacterium]